MVVSVTDRSGWFLAGNMLYTWAAIAVNNVVLKQLKKAVLRSWDKCLRSFNRIDLFVNGSKTNGLLIVQDEQIWVAERQMCIFLIYSWKTEKAFKISQSFKSEKDPLLNNHYSIGQW